MLYLERKFFEEVRPAARNPKECGRGRPDAPDWLGKIGSMVPHVDLTSHGSLERGHSKIHTSLPYEHGEQKNSPSPVNLVGRTHGGLVPPHNTAPITRSRAIPRHGTSSLLTEARGKISLPEMKKPRTRTRRKYTNGRMAANRRPPRTHQEAEQPEEVPGQYESKTKRRDTCYWSALHNKPCRNHICRA